MSNQFTLTEITLDAHKDLKFDPLGAMRVAEKQHIVSLKVNEIAIASTQFPIFLSKALTNDRWVISAINSFEVNANLFVDGDNWNGSYLPTGMQTYPFFLMEKEGGEREYCIGIQEQNPVFSKEEGEPLFEEDGKAGLPLSRATKLLQADLSNEVHTFQFNKMMQEFGLIKPVNLVVSYHDGKTNTLQGLNTIDEQALQNLDDDKLLELRKLGYLLPAYSLIASGFQLNSLLIKHNQKYADEQKILQVSLEEPKPDTE